FVGQVCNLPGKPAGCKPAPRWDGSPGCCGNLLPGYNTPTAVRFYAVPSRKDRESRMNRVPLFAVLLVVTFTAHAPAADQPSPQQVFERRILPIFKSPEPSSCLQCHLSGVDLKNYILPSHEKTFASLRDQ